MEKFHIRKISQIDRVKLEDFYFKAFKFEKKIHDNYAWRYRLGFNDFEPLALIINDKICGHAGLMPINLKINNKIEKGIWFTDFYVDPQYRGSGYGKFLTKSWMEICSLQVTLCNDKSLKIFKKFDWSHNNKFFKNTKIFNYLKFLPISNKLKSADIVTRKKIDELRVEEFNNETLSKIINLSEKSLALQKIGFVRDESWFKWRIIECPYKSDILLLTYKNIYLIAHILKKKNLNVLNVIFSSEVINSNLIKVLSIFSKENNIDYLAFVDKRNNLTDGFFPGERIINFAFHSSNPLIASEINKDLNDIQYIDSDIDFI
jgi:RimJ/RimL family protein N-acetyltransferase